MIHEDDIQQEAYKFQIQYVEGIIITSIMRCNLEYTIIPEFSGVLGR